MKNTILLSLTVLGLAVPAQAQIFPGYGFGSGSSGRDSNAELPESLPCAGCAWRGSTFESHNGLCPVGTRLMKVEERSGKYNEKNVWVRKYNKATICTTLDLNWSFIPAAKDKSCWPGSSYWSNGYCRENWREPYPLRPLNGQCPRGTTPESFSGGTFCARDSYLRENDIIEIPVKTVVTEAQF